RYGSGRVRTTIEQKMVICDVPEENAEALAAELAEHDLQVRPSTFRRQTMACTGIEYCKLAIVDTKHRAMKLIDELEERLPDFDQPLSINVNGCPNACARIQVGDIGLKGQLVVDENGDQVEGFQIHLGGQLGASFGKKVRGLKTTSAGLADYIERVVRNYDKQRDEGETFAAWVQRADEADLKCAVRRRAPLPAGSAWRRSTAPTAARSTWSRARSAAPGTAPTASGPSP